MNYIGKFISNFKDFYNEINSATLTGAIDVIVIQQPDGTYLSSPFHVRFGKIGVLRSREKVVDIEVNGTPVDIHMKLGESGEAFFVEEVEDGNEIPQLWATSPLPPVPDIGEELRKLKFSSELIINNNSANGVIHEFPSDATNFAQNSTDHHYISNNDINSSTYIPTNLTSDHMDSNKNVVSSQTNLLHPVEAHNDLTTQQNKNIIDHVDKMDNDDVPDSTKLKRKKRKRPSTKKRVKSKEISIPLSSDKRGRNSLDENASTADEDSLEKPEEIFQMDDDYCESEEDEGYPSLNSQGLSRSISLPLNSNKSMIMEWPTRKMSSTFTGEFHPFSDGDVTPPTSPSTSRPASPKSDTEYENQKQDSIISDGTEPSWGWGQLPNMPKSSQMSSQDQNGATSPSEGGSKISNNDGAEKRSMLGGMLNFMRSTKKIRHQPETEGILLQSVESTSIDPEIASLYFQRYGSGSLSQKVPITSTVKDEDTESGKGPSLPQSPHSVEGAIGGPCGSTDSDCEERQYHYDFYTDVAMSLCGGLLDADGELSEESFKNSLVTYDKFTENPSILLNPNLVIKLGRKYYNWQTAAPMLASVIVFQRPLPEKTVNELVNEHMPKKKKSKSYSSWWSWRRSEESTKTETMETAETPSSENSEMKSDEGLISYDVCDKTQEVSDMDIADTPKTETCASLLSEMQVSSPDENMIKEELPQFVQAAPNIDSPTSGTALILTQASSTNSSSCSSPMNIAPQTKDELSVPPTTEVENPISTIAKEYDISLPKREKCKKSLRLTSEQIVSLNLQAGPNEVVFSVTTAYQGTTRCKCDIYLWRYDDKIVISDIDGTITKSDVLGHILPMVGKDWAQFGVAKLFTKIKENNYQFLYLSARAIGQARITRDYLRSIRQGQVCLPDGPLLLSPTSLISALHREVIEKKPEEFKISCLKDIQTLYPTCMGNPFYAGFGNKINDTWAYRAVGIPITRIFTINHRGELKQELIQTFQSSYTRLSDQVDHMFPPQNNCRNINGRPAPSFTASEEFSYFTYWRQPIVTFSDDEDFAVGLS